MRLTRYLSQFSSSLLFPGHSVQCSECTYIFPNLLASRYIHTSTSTSTMVATLATDHTITHDLPPYPSLSPVHRAKRENKMVEFSYPSSHTHNTCTYTYTYIYVVQPPARGLHIGTLSNLSPLPSLYHHHHDYTKNATRTFDDEKDLWNYVHVHDMYISLVWGRLLISTCT